MNMAEPSPSEATQFTVNHQPPITIRRKSPYSQALAWQDFLNKLRDTPNLKPVAASALARVWKEIEYLKRDIKMQPKPRPIDVTGMKGGKKVKVVAPVVEEE
jgi:hypothetical protein